MHLVYGYAAVAFAAVLGAWYSGLLSSSYRALATPDGQLNLLSEGIGIVLTTLLISPLTALFLRILDDRRWLDTRTRLCDQMCRAMHTIAHD